jgi:hypothetical protein
LATKQSHIVEATPEHVELLIANLRDSDREEILAMGYDDVEAAIRQTYRASTVAWSGWVDDDLLCVFGVQAGSYLLGHGVPWMLGTPTMNKYEIRFLHNCKPVVEQMLRGYPRLTNYVYARNKRTIRWLKWLGFTVHPPRPAGLKQEPFCRFTMEA